MGCSDCDSHVVGEWNTLFHTDFICSIICVLVHVQTSERLERGFGAHACKQVRDERHT